jgi:cyclophilin family peptidyl-prolyl cis-trans isomerase
MDIAGTFKDNLKVFLPILGLVAVIIAFYTVDLNSSSLTSITPMTKNTRANYKANVQTNFGDFTIDLYENSAPKNVENFVSLSKEGFYDNLKFHRVIDGFIIQTGDPNGTGYGGAGYYVNDEISRDLFFKEYTVAMASEGRVNTNSSQFFITLPGGEFSHLDGNYTIIGEVVSDFSVVDKIGSVPVDQNHFPRTDVILKTVEIVEDRK